MHGKTFRDPVHGDIRLPAPLLDLCDTPEFQRLRSVRQLGTAHLVYPGAVHTRFEHSLGTCHLTARLLTNLGKDPDAHLQVLAAALLHDLTHIPFGHTLEDERRVFERHDAPQRVLDLLPRGSLGAALRKLKLLDPVLQILTGRPEQPWHAEIFAGTVCADLLDYLRRDAMFCGLSQTYDDRIFSMFRLDEHGHVYLDAFKQGLIRQDVISEVVNLLRLRYFLGERVYFHHTKTASGAMISRAVEAALLAGWTLKELQTLGDDTLLYRLEQDLAHDPAAALLLQHLRSRQIYKRAFVITRRIGEARRKQLTDEYHEQPARRRELEETLIRQLRFKPGELVVYCPAYGMQLKAADVRVRLSEGAPRLLSGVALPDLQVLRERHQDLWKLYVFIAPKRVGQADRVSRACEAAFLEPNHLSELQGGQLFLDL